MSYPSPQSVSVGTQVSLIEIASAQVIKGKLSEELDFGKSIKIGRYRTSELVTYNQDDAGIHISTKNNEYRLALKDNPADMVLAAHTEVSLVKVLLNDSYADSVIMPGEGVDGILDEAMCIGQPISLISNDGNSVRTSTLIRPYSLKNNLTLLQTATSVYEISLL